MVFKKFAPLINPYIINGEHLYRFVPKEGTATFLNSSLQNLVYTFTNDKS